MHHTPIVRALHLLWAAGAAPQRRILRRGLGIKSGCASGGPTCTAESFCTLRLSPHASLCLCVAPAGVCVRVWAVCVLMSRRGDVPVVQGSAKGQYVSAACCSHVPIVARVGVHAACSAYPCTCWGLASHSRGMRGVVAPSQA